MAGGMNLAAKFSKTVDERFYKKSQAMLAVSDNYDFTGAKTVNVYSIPVVAMSDYARNGTNRYGTPDDLTRNVQSCVVQRDRAFTFVIDRGDKVQSDMISDAGRALSRQINEVVIPEFDAYVFQKLADAAKANGSTDSTAATKSNAYSLFLKAMEYMGDHNVPDEGRVCFCTYKFANLLKQDSAFMRYGDASQQMLSQGVIGEVDGCRIVKVASSRLPNGCAFLLTHPVAACAPKQLEDYKIHDNPPGIDGWLVEGRMLYDCFALNEKADAIWFQGGAAALRALTVGTAGTSSGKTTVTVAPQADSGHSWYYKTGTSAAEVTYGTAITPSASTWIALAASGTEITPTTTGDKIIQVVEVDGDKKPVGLGQAAIHLG